MWFTRAPNPPRVSAGPAHQRASTDFEIWAKESFKIATKFAYRNGGRIGIPKGGSRDCAVVALAPVLQWDMLLVPVGLLIGG